MRLSIVRLGYWNRLAERGFPHIRYWNSRTSKAIKPNQIIRQWSDELLVGNVIKTSTIGVSQLPCAQIAVTRNEFNNVLNMYFTNITNFWALDDSHAAGKNRNCSMGDVVMIRKLIEPYTLKVTHRLEKRLFQHGNMIDPISGKRIYGTEYEDVRKVRENIINQVIGHRLTARQMAASRLYSHKIDMQMQRQQIDQ